MIKRHTAFLLSLLVVVMLSSAVASGLVRRAMPTSANAEEQALTVQLRYVAGISTWGPTNVYGAAMLWPKEQLATIGIHLLPHLLGGQQYMWWAVNSQTQKALRLGTFNSSYAGDASQDVYLLQDLPANANEVLVTVWHPGDSSTSPGPNRSVAGYFPLPPAPIATATALVLNPAPNATVLPTAIPGINTTPGHHPNYTHRVHTPVIIHNLPSTGGGPLVHAYEDESGSR